MSFPYLARTALRYKSPHATDLSFAKDETIRVTGQSPEEEDWLLGETLDGSKSGGFPKDFITPIENSSSSALTPPEPSVAEDIEEPASDEAPPVPASAPAPPSPKIAPATLPPSSAPTPAPIPAPDPAPAPPMESKGAPKAPAGEEAEPSRQSMKDRLAFFAAAQTKAAPPPLKPKPATGGMTWSQRQKLRQEQEAKEGGSTAAPTPATSVPAAAPAPAAAAAAASPTTTLPIKRQGEGEGMSAADAQASITKGGSLRERMAALQGAGAFGQPEEKPAPPAPSGKAWKRPPAPPQPEPEDEGVTEGDRIDSPTVEKGEEIQETDAPEQTEEEDEKARRAAIAARMAKLGARGPMGMAAPPKPARKPVQEPEVQAVVPDESQTASSTTESNESHASPIATSPPSSIPMPAIARRTAPPRRRGPAAANAAEAARVEPSEPAQRLGGVGPDNGREPPPQVMVAGEEEPLPKTERQIAEEREQEAIGRGPDGASGAEAAGIALMPQGEGDEAEPNNPDGPLLGAQGGAAAEGRGVGTVSDRLTVGKIVDEREDEPQELEDGLVEGGDEKDEIMEEAQRGELEIEETAEPTMVPIHPPAEVPEDEDEDESPPPPPPPRMTMSHLPKDEIELKHAHDAEAEAEDSDEDAAPPPPARRGITSEKPLGPRPLPSPERATAHRALPPPPQGNPMIPPRDEEQEERELDDEGDEEPPVPPPRRQPSLPMPIQTGAHAATGNSSATPIAAAKISPSPIASPTSPRPPVRSPSQLDEPASPVDNEDASRRSGIAARMAKLGGVKFGMPPPAFKKRSDSTGPSEEPQSPTSPLRETPLTAFPPQAADNSETTPVNPEDDGETPDAEAARRRATLARLRAGGALGFGMFKYGSKAEVPDERGLQEEQEEEETAPPPEAVPQEEEEAPPPTPSRPPVPVSRPSLPPPPTAMEAEVDEDDIPPPPPPGRPPIPATRSSLPPPPREMEIVPPSPRRDSNLPPSPTTSMNRPPIPVDRQMPPAIQTTLQQPLGRVVDEPGPMDSPTDGNPASPARPQFATSPSGTAASPRRSASIASRSSFQAGFSPASRQASRAEIETRQSFSQSRPGYNELQEAANTHGARLARAARGMFEQGKRAHLGDGSPTGFVLVAMEQAQVPPPQATWGQVVLEQEGPSVLKRYDEARPGDIVAFHDAKLKGKKGLTSYHQNVGSVEEPLVGIVSESEAKKHKLRVLQVERGVPEEVSYRCDDLKSGKIVVYRPGIYPSNQ